MPTTTYEVTNSRDLGAATQEIVDNLYEDFATIDYTKFFWGEHSRFEQLHGGYFTNAAGPDGPWPPLAPSTIRRKGHSKILIDTNRLRDSLRNQTGDSVREAITDTNEPSMVFGTMVPYSAFHDVATENRPARRHVGMTDEYFGGIAERLLDYVIEDLKRA